ncbi:hypothetical protein EVAR_11164_1 [Eumeta japonica]|uniref:Uncharacterized protein n=1 Tax=Eumeta variegata TaxID=151549 RepID=A0A4C1U417_EUMVA|nr:hypothetical protein EVAR_11164_1 [Eumeta japonica]
MGKGVKIIREILRKTHIDEEVLSRMKTFRNYQSADQREAENRRNKERMATLRKKRTVTNKRSAGQRERRFNAPQTNKVAVVIVDNECSRCDIIIQRRSNKLQRISETHHSSDALQYPIIFWQDEDGYHFNIQQIDPATEWLSERIIVATKNDIVNGINNIIQEMIPREEKIYISIDSMTDEQESINFPTEF